MPTPRQIVSITTAFKENQESICCVTDDGLAWKYVYNPQKSNDEYGGWEWVPMRPVPDKGLRVV